jgi:hypothetical protein
MTDHHVTTVHCKNVYLLSSLSFHTKICKLYELFLLLEDAYGIFEKNVTDTLRTMWRSNDKAWMKTVHSFIMSLLMKTFSVTSHSQTYMTQILRLWSAYWQPQHLDMKHRLVLLTTELFRQHILTLLWTTLRTDINSCAKITWVEFKIL